MPNRDCSNTSPPVGAPSVSCSDHTCRSRRAELVASRDLCYFKNMSPLKRKRGRHTLVDKKAKKLKFVANEGDVLDEVEQEKKNEVTIPAPVSMVSAVRVVKSECCNELANANLFSLWYLLDVVCCLCFAVILINEMQRVAS